MIDAIGGSVAMLLVLNVIEGRLRMMKWIANSLISYTPGLRLMQRMRRKTFATDSNNAITRSPAVAKIADRTGC